MAQPLANAPRDLLLDADNDLVVTTDLQFSYGIEAVAQSCRIALQLFQGEWFLDLDAGIPYWDEILSQKPAVAAAVARQEFRRELEAIDGVINVLRLDVTYARTLRTLRVVWQVQTSLGNTPVDTLELAV